MQMQSKCMPQCRTAADGMEWKQVRGKLLPKKCVLLFVTVCWFFAVFRQRSHSCHVCEAVEKRRHGSAGYGEDGECSGVAVAILCLSFCVLFPSFLFSVLFLFLVYCNMCDCFFFLKQKKTNGTLK